MTPATRFRPPPRFLGALVLLAALLLGALGHGWHHFVDHECESATGTASHACVQCSSLHAAAEADATPVMEAPCPQLLVRVLAMHLDAPSVYAPAPRSARAPPLA